MKRLPLLITCTFLLTLGLNQVLAQASEVNLTVSPPVSYLHVAPGTSANHTIILENSGETPITVLPTIVDFTTDGKTGRAIVTNQLTFPYVSMGVDNSVKEVTIPPNKKAQLTLYISVPHEAQEKEYPLTVLFFSKSEQEKAQNFQQNSQKSNSQINAAIGSNLIVLVSKQNSFTKTLEVLNINAPKFVDSFQQIEFSPLVKNNSLGAVVASGSAKIVNWRKQTIVEFDVYPDTILGHNSREIRALLSNSDPQKPEVGSLAYKPKFLIGPYQIVLTLTGQDGTVITQSVHVFYALPIAILAALLLGIALFYFLSKQKPKMSSL
ncbi:MAG: hypothetical protein BroJett025_00050 [Patescibacteria group bacterium]|nr:MAG: hypothetical protein BroJett025_00050 [Patescibacteria group bacterium]